MKTASLKKGPLCLLLIFSLTITAVAQLPSPSILISPVEGAVGTSISVRGSNFLLNSEIRVYWEDKLVASGKADSKGSFSVSVKVPEVPCGYYSITAIDEVRNNAYTSFRVIPKITKLSPSKGAPDSLVNVTGNGFSANSQVEVRFIDPFNETWIIAVSKVEANEKGVIQAQLKIPRVNAGEYKIYALDARTGLKTEELKFTVEEPKPTTPKPTTTPVQSETGNTNKTNQTTKPTTQQKTPVTYTPKSTPGFELLIAIGGVATTLFVLRKHKQ